MNQEEATTEEAVIEQKLEEVRSSNMERLLTLEAQGYGMSPLLQLKLRMDTLTSWVVDEDVSTAFELMYEALMAGEISQVESEVARLKLTEGIPSGQQKLG